MSYGTAIEENLRFLGWNLMFLLKMAYFLLKWSELLGNVIFQIDSLCNWVNFGKKILKNRNFDLKNFLQFLQNTKISGNFYIFWKSRRLLYILGYLRRLEERLNLLSWSWKSRFWWTYFEHTIACPPNNKWYSFFRIETLKQSLK